MNKLKARGVLKKTGFSYLWLEICSNNHFKNPMFSRTIKNAVIKNALATLENRRSLRPDSPRIIPINTTT